MSDPCDSDGFLEAVARNQRAINAAQPLLARGDTVEAEQMMNDAGPRFDLMFLSADVMNHNEMHDCQKMVVGPTARERTYGPLLAIFLVGDEAATANPNGKVVAEIINFTGEKYDPLGIPSGKAVYCLWMQPTGPGWASHLIPAPADSRPFCAGVDAPTDAPTLQTEPRSIQAQSATPRYPTTARWMWDERTSQQYLGARCGDAWCEIAPANITLATGDFASWDRIPGWSDQQYVGLADANGRLVPSRLMGTILPGPGVQFADGEAQRAALDRTESLGGVVVAFIELAGDHPEARAAYRSADKLEIEAQPDASGVSRDPITMRYHKDADEWRARGNGTPTDREHVIARAPGVLHSGMRTVRWRWVEEDEQGWIPCGGGCCPYKETDGTA